MVTIVETPPRPTQRELSQKAAALKAAKLLSKIEVVDRVGRCFATLWQWMRDGRFPRAHDLNGSPVWFEAEIDAFLATLPVKSYLGDDKYEPLEWRRQSPGNPHDKGRPPRAKKAVTTRSGPRQRAKAAK